MYTIMSFLDEFHVEWGGGIRIDNHTRQSNESQVGKRN